MTSFPRMSSLFRENFATAADFFATRTQGHKASRADFVAITSCRGDFVALGLRTWNLELETSNFKLINGP